MFTFDNTHILTGYLKQLLASVPIPTCRVYTKENALHRATYGVEDPRILPTTQLLHKNRPSMPISYVRDNSIFQYRWNSTNPPADLHKGFTWHQVVSDIFEDDKYQLNFTKVLKSSGCLYDTKTHEYLGDYLRFLRDYHDVNLMSLYNCFNNRIYNNVHCHIKEQKVYERDENGDTIEKLANPEIIFSSYDKKYNIYAVPVRLFEKYTIAIDSPRGVELCCGFYKASFDDSARAMDLVKRTYVKVQQSIFSQPFIYDKLVVDNWTHQDEITADANGQLPLFTENKISRLDIAAREADLRLFIKLPTSCKSSITILEGDYRNFNDCRYTPRLVPLPYTKPGESAKTLLVWDYVQNHYIVNTKPEVRVNENSVKRVNLNTVPFKPISKLQLLEFNTGISYPFADRLIEYLVGSAITPTDEISDNIRRAQQVMNDNGVYFEMDGIWEPKMQKLIYDQLMVAGPFERVQSQKVLVPEDTSAAITTTTMEPIPNKYHFVDRRQGRHPRLGHTRRSTLYDILGYVDRHAEKYYGSWTFSNKHTNPIQVTPKNTIQDVNIYGDLYNIK